MKPKQFFDEPMFDAYKRTTNAFPLSVASLNNLSEEEKKSKLIETPWLIGFIENPSQNLILSAVSSEGMVLSVIKNRTVEVEIAAIQQNPDAIRWIERPCKKVKEAWVMAKLVK